MASASHNATDAAAGVGAHSLSTGTSTSVMARLRQKVETITAAQPARSKKDEVVVPKATLGKASAQTTKNTTPNKAKKRKSFEMCSSDSEDGDKASAGKGESTTKQTPKRPCNGCSRVVGADHSFFASEMGFDWRYQQQSGCWCKECGNVGRLSFRRIATLTLLEQWLKSAEEKRLSFTRKQIAYVSLKFEGVGHISAEAVDKREKLLDFVFALLGVPWPFMEVAPLSSFDPATCYPIRAAPGADSGGEQFLCLRAVSTPAPLGRARPRFVTANHARHGWPLHPLPADAQPLKDVWDSLPEEMKIKNALPSTSSGREDHEDSFSAASSTSSNMVSPAQMMLIKRTDDITCSLVLLLGSLSVKSFGEKDLNAMLARFIRVRNDVLQTPYSSTLLSDIDAGMLAIHHAKKVARPLRDYVRLAKTSYLIKIGADLSAMSSWLEKRGGKLCPALQQVSIKTEFLITHDDDVAAAVEMLKGFESWPDRSQHPRLHELQPREHVVVECLEAVICAPIAKQMEDVSRQRWMQLKKKLAADTTCYCDCLVFLCSVGALLAPFYGVVSAYRTLLKAALGEEKVPANVSAAKQKLQKEIEGQKINAALKNKNQVGYLIACDADLVLAVGEMDKECDGVFAVALGSFAMDGIPCVDETKGGAVAVASAFLVADEDRCKLTQVVCDGMKQLGHVWARWSQARLAQELDSVGLVLGQITLCLSALDARASQITRNGLGPIFAALGAGITAESLADGSWPHSQLGYIEVDRAEQFPEGIVESFATEVDA